MLASAALHATWNAWVKARPDPSAAVVALSIGGALPNILLLFIVGLPPQAAWPWMAGTVCLSTIAALLLAAAYRHGDLAVAYPLVRGMIPVALAVAAVPIFGEPVTALGAAGVAAVAAGLGLIAWESARRSKTMTVAGLGLAALGGLLNAGSALIDAKGVRASDAPLPYAAAIAIASAAFMVAIELRRRDLLATLRAEWPLALFGPILANGSYLIYVWSIQRAPIARVSAVRESSTLFALLIGAVVLRELVGGLRVAAVLVIAAGVVVLRLS